MEDKDVIKMIKHINIIMSVSLTAMRVGFLIYFLAFTERVFEYLIPVTTVDWAGGPIVDFIVLLSLCLACTLLVFARCMDAFTVDSGVLCGLNKLHISFDILLISISIVCGKCTGWFVLYLTVAVFSAVYDGLILLTLYLNSEYCFRMFGGFRVRTHCYTSSQYRKCVIQTCKEMGVELQGGKNVT